MDTYALTQENLNTWNLLTPTHTHTHPYTTHAHTTHTHHTHTHPYTHTHTHTTHTMHTHKCRKHNGNLVISIFNMENFLFWQ